MINLTELQAECVMLHTELEKLTEIGQTFSFPLLMELIAFKKEYLKERIEENLNLQEQYWLKTIAEKDVIRIFYDNPGITQQELSRRCNRSHTVISKILTKSFKNHSYEQTNIRQ